MTIFNDIPERFKGPAAWVGSAMAATPERWIKTLTPSEIDELETAATQYLAEGRDIGDITAATFPVPKFAAHVATLRDTLIHGHGFEVLRGLPIAR